MAYVKNGRGAQRQNNNRGNHQSRGTLMDVLRDKNPEAFDIARFIKNSANLRRVVGLGIRAQILQKNTVTKDDKIFIKFGLTHYTVRINGLGTDYPYSHLELLRAYLAASYVIDAQIKSMINNMSVKEYDEPIEENTDLASDESRSAIADIANHVLAHINDQVVDDKD